MEDDFTRAEKLTLIASLAGVFFGCMALAAALVAAIAWAVQAMGGA